MYYSKEELGTISLDDLDETIPFKASAVMHGHLRAQIMKIH
jgi:hypothetical protein